MKRIIIIIGIISIALFSNAQKSYFSNDTSIFKYYLKSEHGFRLNKAKNTSNYAHIYLNDSIWLSDFSYGWNGTVTPNGYNIFLGHNTGNNTNGSTATSGSHSSYNIGFGTNNLTLLTLGYKNIALGTDVLNKLTLGINNIGIGQNVCSNLVSGGYNIGIGYQAMYVGGITSSNLIGIGRQSLYSVTSGTPLIGIGYGSLYSITTGTYLIGIGLQAGRYITGGVTANTTSDYSIYIGDSTRASANDNVNEIVIGYNVTGNGSNTVTIGNPSITANYFKGSINSASANIGNISGGNYAQIESDGEINIISGTPGHYKVNGIPQSYIMEEWYTDAATSGTGETDLLSYTVPANTLNNNGDKLMCSFTAIGDASALGYVEPYFAGTNLASDIVNMINSGIIKIDVEIIRVSATVARCVITAGQGGNYNYTTYIELTSKDWTTTNVLKLTGTAAAGTITAKMGYVEYKPVAQ